MPATENAPLRLPEALRKRMGSTHDRGRVHALMRQSGLSTVCEEARCPNIGECFSSGTATFMILGDRCTRRCHFCNVSTGKPRPVDADEPARLAEAAAELGLQHVVITSVDRDELADKGAHHWAACIRAVKERLPHATVEVLTPDFGGDLALADVVLDAGPHVFNHNLETVERLYRQVRPQSRWDHTSNLLAHAARRAASSGGGLVVKSGIMVGLGETDDEVLATLDHMKALGVGIATIGQYLRPSLKHWPVARYVDDDAYARFTAYGAGLGLAHVFAGAFVRSSYHAAEAKRAHDAAPAARQSHLLRVLP
jgi:lipoic acid synthetase